MHKFSQKNVYFFVSIYSKRCECLPARNTKVSFQL
uniref:Uncharacterized protein n=1 Tax=Arundo donax TaxID=35708 RepID=A0A0A9E0H4_ARUDO